jgi:ABC-type Fe3+ transport system permease subunit
MTDIPTVPEPAALPKTSRLAIASLVCGLGAICLPVLCGVLVAIIGSALASRNATGPENVAPYIAATCAIRFLFFGSAAAGIILGIAALIGISRKKGSLKGHGLLPFLGLLDIFRKAIVRALIDG